jgi:hypothetical protein
MKPDENGHQRAARRSRANADVQQAKRLLQERHAGAAVQVSSRVVDRLFGRLAEEATDVTPVAESITDAERMRVTGWDEPEPDPDAGTAEPAPPAAAARKSATIAVPKTAQQMRRRRRNDIPPVRGLA